MDAPEGGREGGPLAAEEGRAPWSSFAGMLAPVSEAALPGQGVGWIPKPVGSPGCYGDLDLSSISHQQCGYP